LLRKTVQAENETEQFRRLHDESMRHAAKMQADLENERARNAMQYSMGRKFHTQTGALGIINEEEGGYSE